MQKALAEAFRAMEHGDVPVGAVVVHNGTVIAKGHNQTELLGDPTAHAEMIAITSAAEYLKSPRLTDCTLYVTHEPCIMCAGALLLARVPTLFFGAYEPKFGACGSLFNLPENNQYNHEIKIFGGLMEDECKLLIQEFFKKRRTETGH